MAAGDYIFEIIDNENDARYCAQLLAEEFCGHNPITLFDQITPAHFYNVCSWPLMKDVYREYLSFLIRVRSTGKIIGAIVAGDLYLEHQRKHLLNSCVDVQSIPARELLKEMIDLFIMRDFGQELQPNMVLHVGLGAIRAQYSGNGIATQMRKSLAEHARDKKGFQYLFVQTTNPATRHIYVNKMHGKEVTIIDPTTWKWKNNADEIIYPYKDYKRGVIPNILVKL